MNFMEKIKHKKVYYYSLICIFLGLSVMLLSTPITYAINDDVAMRNIASGVISGKPDGHLIFIKYILGCIIAGFYHLYDGIDWYGCFMIGIELYCAAMILKRFERYLKKDFVFGIVVSTTIFIIVIYDNLVNFQFTVVAAIVAATAVFLYNTLEGENKIYQKEYLTILVLSWLSYCIRSEVFIMALPFAGICFLTKKEKVKNKIIFAIILMMGIIAVEGIEVVAYDSKEWKVYQEVNKKRSEVYDYYMIPPFDENEDFYNSLGMKDYDVDNLSEYRLYFVDEIENGKIGQIAEYSKSQWKEQNNFRERIDKGLGLIGKRLKENEFGSLFFITQMLLVINLIDAVVRKKGTIWVSLSFFVIEAILWIYLASAGRLPERVIVSLLIIELLSLMSIWYINQNESLKNSSKDNWKNLAIVLMCILIVDSGQKIEQRQNIRYDLNEQYRMLEDYFETNPKDVYFTDTYSIAKYTENYNFIYNKALGNFLTLGDWLSFSPLSDERLNTYGIKNIPCELLDNRNIFLVLENVTEGIDKYYEGEFVDIRWDKLEEINIEDIELCIYKLQR